MRKERILKIGLDVGEVALCTFEGANTFFVPSKGKELNFTNVRLDIFL